MPGSSSLLSKKTRKMQMQMHGNDSLVPLVLMMPTSVPSEVARHRRAEMWKHYVKGKMSRTCVFSLLAGSRVEVCQMIWLVIVVLVHKIKMDSFLGWWLACALFVAQVLNIDVCQLLALVYVVVPIHCGLAMQ